MRQIEIEWVQTGITVTADLSKERNPGLADLLWNELLHYNSLQNHALVSGKHLYHLVPHHQLVYLEAEQRRIAPSPRTAPYSCPSCNIWR